MSVGMWVEILKEPISTGYPAPYLLARLRGRSAAFVRDWEQIAAPGRLALPARYGTAEGIVPVDVPPRFLGREYRWAYGQMEPALRAVFAPFFAYVELKSIFSAARLAGEPDAVGQVLLQSLLADDFTDKLRAAASTPEALDVVVKRFSGVLEGLAHLTPAAGTLAVERGVMEAFLAYAAGPGTHVVVRGLFSRLVDMRNILSAYKHLRWELDGERGVVPGGTITPSRLDAASGEMAVDGLVRRLTKREEGGIESRLLSWALSYEHVVRSDPSPEGPVLSYLLRLLREVRNLTLLLASDSAGREPALAEFAR